MNKKYYKYIVGVLTIFMVLELKSQDIHFSQFYASPLTLNPSLTGMFDGQYRATVQYRDQWSTFMEPYQTSGISFEKNFHIKNGDQPGIGLSFTNDKTGTINGINTLNIHLSGAYNKLIKTTSGSMVFGAGFQVGYTKKNTFGDFTYPDQWVNSTFNPSIGRETLPFTKPSYLDVNFGTILNYVFGMSSAVFIGGSAYHLNRSEETLIRETVENRRNTRWVLHGGSRLVIGSGELSLIPNFIMMFQNGAREINLGTSLEYDLGLVTSLNAKLSLGGWYRLKDAFIIITSITVKDLQFGLSYDINTSDLTLASNGRGGFEITMRYILKSHSINLESFPGIRM